MPDIFLSYNREDQARARVFAEAFSAQGFDVWWDVGLRAGEAYDQVTETALRTAKAVVVLWSKRSVESRWVRAEATLADRQRTLVPCMIEACERPIMFELVQTAELSHWRGDAADKAWLAFLADVQRFVGAAALPAPAPVQAAPTAQETLRPGQRGDAPSLAVLPFTNRSGQADDDVFAIGLVEDVISALSQGVDVRVLGAAATRGLAISDLAAVGRQLGVKYLLEGNVRRVGANLRVTAQLLEAESGAVLWTSRFDRPLDELAELQEELVLDIAAGLNAEVSSQEVARVLAKPDDLTAWEAVQRGLYLQWSTDPTRTAASAAQEMARALAIAPDYALANAAVACAAAGAWLFSGKDDPAAVKRVRTLAARALQLAPNDAAVLALVANALGPVGDHAEALRHSTRAVQKTPGSGMVQFFHALALAMQDRWEDSLGHLATARRLMPGSHMLRLVSFWMAEGHAALGRWAEADMHCDELLVFGGPNIHLQKARISLALGREAVASEHVAIVRGTGVPLAYFEVITARLSPPGPVQDQWLADLRRLWAEAGGA